MTASAAALEAVEAARLEGVRATYHAGLEQVLAAAAADPRTATYWPLRALAEFWRASVEWLEGPGTSVPLQEPGARRLGWLAVVSQEPDGPSASDAVELGAGGESHLIRIRPERVTEMWAGLFLVHELAHLADRVLWGETTWESRHAFLEAELRAAELELAAASAVTGGALLPALDAVLKELAPTTVTELVERTLALSPSEFEAMAPEPLSRPPASPTERSMRHDFFRTALVLRYAGRQELDQETLLLGLDTLLLYTAAD